MTPVRRLRVVAAVEAVTVVILLVNLATVHLPVVASVLGPVHGTAYLTGIALTWSGGLPRAARLLACIPAVGAWLAVRTLPHPAPPHPAPPHPAPPHPAPPHPAPPHPAPPRPGPHSPSDRARERP